MNATYSGTDITIQSTWLDDLTGVTSLALTSKINCCDPEYSMAIALVDVALGAFTIDGANFYGVDELADGIYSFELSILYSNGSVRRLKACMFVDEVTKCKVAEFVKDTADLEREMDYFILKQADECACECSSFCTILERVWKKLGVIECDICNESVNCTEC